MTQAQGYRSTLKMGFETVYNTAPTDAILVPVQKSNIKSKQNMIEDKTIRGRRDPAQPGLGNTDVSGNLVVPLDVFGIGNFLKGIFGDPTTTAGTGSLHNHEFKPSFFQPSLTFEQGFTDIGQYFVYSGCKISKLGIDFGGDGELTASIDVMGAKEVIASSSIDITPTTYSLIKFGNFQASIKEAGVSIANITKCSVNIDCGLDGDTYVIGGQGFRGSVNEGIMNISGSITALFENRALLDKAINGTKSSIELNVVNGTNSLTIKLPEVMYERNSPSIDGAKGVLVELNYKAFWDTSAENAAIVVTLVNSQASYA